MNRGSGRQIVFHEERYYQAFLKTLNEAADRFEAVIHAYCLMGNHYHLLVETPRGNLDRIMRHINGIYTQRYNRLRKTDGPLFRGRYKAILVEEDAYLLQLSRYIHRNPIEIKGADSGVLSTYPWSSYLAYINKAPAEPWLEREKTYQMLGQRRRYAGYKAYVELGVDEEIETFYGGGNLAGVLGGEDFKELLSQDAKVVAAVNDFPNVIRERPSVKAIIQIVSKVFDVHPLTIRQRRPGRQIANEPRKVAIYCCQNYADLSLKSIAKEFGLNHAGSESSVISDIRKKLMKGELKKELGEIEVVFGIIK